MATRRLRIWHLFIGGRSLVTGLVLFLLLILNGLRPSESLFPLFLLSIVQFVSNSFYLYLWRRTDIPILSYLALCSEVVLISLLIYVLGPDGWVFVLAYLWPIIMAGWLIGRRAIPELTLLSGVCFTALIVVQRSDWAVSERVLVPGGTSQALLLVYPYLAFVSLLVWLVTREVEHSQEDLAQRNAELQHERNVLRGILAHMTEAVFLVDAEDQIVTANQAASAMLAIKDDALLPRWLAQGVESTANEPSEPGQRQMLDHDRRTISLSVTSLPIEGNAAEGRLFVALDVTEQMELERMRADFVAYASHELRTPLTTIKTMVRLLLMDTDPASTEHEYLAVIDTQAARQTRLINNLLDFTRLEAGKYDLQAEEVSPCAVIDAAVSACRPMALEKGLDLQVDGEGLPSSFISDASALEQVLVNLLSNAVKFTEPGGRVWIGGTTENGSLSFSIVDSGIGMSPEQLGHIFTRFYTVHHPRKHGEGTGLGLMISRMIVERLGGHIEVQSREGQGSTFVVTLPAERKAIM